mgnify:CR=1 FL=1
MFCTLALVPFLRNPSAFKALTCAALLLVFIVAPPLKPTFVSSRQLNFTFLFLCLTVIPLLLTVTPCERFIFSISSDGVTLTLPPGGDAFGLLALPPVGDAFGLLAVAPLPYAVAHCSCPRCRGCCCARGCLQAVGV